MFIFRYAELMELLTGFDSFGSGKNVCGSVCGTISCPNERVKAKEINNVTSGAWPEERAVGRGKMSGWREEGNRRC